MITNRFHRNGRVIISGYMTGGGRSGASSGYLLTRGARNVCSRDFIFQQPKFITLCHIAGTSKYFSILLLNRCASPVTHVRRLKKSKGGGLKKF